MVGKKKQGKEKKKKKSKKGDGSHIGAAIIPAASLTAVRNIPPPPADQLLRDPKSNSGILSASLLGRMYEEEAPTTETDTSLIDYENARQTIPLGTGYLGRSGEDGTHTFPGPPPGFDDNSDEDVDELEDSQVYSKNVEVHAFMDSPGPDGQRQARSRSHSPMARSHSPMARSHSPMARSHSPMARGRHSPLARSMNDTDASAAVGAASLRGSGTSVKSSHKGSLGASGGSRRPPHGSGRSTPQAALEERIEAQMIGVQYKAALEGTDMAISRAEELSHASSPKLQSLREQKMELQQQTTSKAMELQQQQLLQAEVMARLQDLAVQQPTQASAPEMKAQLYETQSVTDQTLRQQDQMIGILQEQVTVLGEEKKELEELNEQLQMDVMNLRRMPSNRDEDDPSNARASQLKRRLRDYKDECDTLRVAVHRLNSELSKYQTKFRPLTSRERDELPGLPMKGPKPQWLISTKYLAPLFVAYDDRLKDRDELLQKYEEGLNVLKHGAEEIVKENQRLHLRIEQSDISGPVSMTEWRQLQEQCRLVLEENQLLMEQLDVQQNKTKDLHSAHVQEVSKLSKRLVTAEAERAQHEQEVEEVKGRLSKMKRDYDSAVIDHKTKEALEDHFISKLEHEKIVGDVKNAHAMEIETISTKLQMSGSERKGLAVRVDDLKHENQLLEADMKVLQRAHKKSQKKLQLLQHALESAEVKEQTAEHYLTSVVRMAEKTVQERDSFAMAVQDKDRQRKAAVNRIMETNVSKNKMEEKIKSLKMKASEKLELAASRMKEQDQDFSQQRHEYEREIKHLRLLLRERDEMLQQNNGEKKQLEDDLETMWQVTSADNQKMRQTLRSKLRKLKVSTRLPSSGLLEDQLLLGDPPIGCDSDDEA